VVLDEAAWRRLLRSIRKGTCTPVIGAGASASVVAGADRLAAGWAEEYSYPLADRTDLARVTQFIAISEQDPMLPKELMIERLQGVDAADLSATPYPSLAELPFPLYITTNYDDLISQALNEQRSPAKTPVVDYCRWNRFEEVAGSEPPGRKHSPTAASPLVYHLHGHAAWPSSLVLTEEDYLDFLIAASETKYQRSEFLRHDVRHALAGNSLLFIGYRLSDWTFRVLFRGLMKNIQNMGRPSVAIQLAPQDREVAAGMLPEAQDYLQKYLGRLHAVESFTMYWGDATEFSQELLDRWRSQPDADR
jgi:hypothetical protein